MGVQIRKGRYCGHGTVRGQNHGEARAEEPNAGVFTPFRWVMCLNQYAIRGSVERAGDVASPCKSLDASLGSAVPSLWQVLEPVSLPTMGHSKIHLRGV